MRGILTGFEKDIISSLRIKRRVEIDKVNRTALYVLAQHVKVVVEIKLV